MAKRRTLPEVARDTGHSLRRLQVLCKEGRIRGARLTPTPRGPVWTVPAGELVIRPGSRGPRLLIVGDIDLDC